MDRLKKFGRSFRHAARGFQYVLAHEKNFQNELIVAFFVVIGMLLFDVTRSEVIVLTFVIMIVLITELLNTVVERMVDILKPRVHPYAKLIKDLMAACVLLTSLFSVIIGLIIFLPYIIDRFLMR